MALVAYATQLYVALVGVVLLPVYLHLLGPDLFGLIGLYLALQALIQIADFGFSPALLRAFSRYRAGTLAGEGVASCLRSVAVGFGGVSLLLGGGGMLLSGWVATRVLDIKGVPSGEVAQYLDLMVLATLPKLWVSVYRSALVGLECQMTANRLVALIATLRFVGVVPLLYVTQEKGLVFFLYQVAISMIEVGLFWWALQRRGGNAVRGGGHLRLLSCGRELWPIAAPMAVLSALWIVLTHFDRFILVRLLDLSSYGYYTLAAVAAAGILSFIPPLAQVLVPRMTILVDQGARTEILSLFRRATGLVMSFFLALGGALYAFAHPVLDAWTGDPIAARAAGDLLAWFALANALAGVQYLPFLLQYAHGTLRLHFIGGVLSVCLQLPAMVWFGQIYGAAGVVLSILGFRLAYLFLWTPYALSRFLAWADVLSFYRALLSRALAIAGILSVLSLLLGTVHQRWLVGILLLIGFLSAFLLSLLLGRETRELVGDQWRSLVHRPRAD